MADPITSVQSTTVAAIAPKAWKDGEGAYFPQSHDRAELLDPALLASGKLVSIEPVLALHRGEGSAIGFYRAFPPCGLCPECRNGKKCPEAGMKAIATVKQESLRDQLPLFASDIVADSYFTVNGLKSDREIWERDPEGNPIRERKSKITGLSMCRKKKQDIRYLNACYAEIDFYKVDDPGKPGSKITLAQAFSTVYAATIERSIPIPTMIASSGRGLYLFWFLRDFNKPGQPALVTPETADLYDAVNKRINRVFAPLGADPRAKDRSRILRVPGSLHSKANKLPVYSLTFFADPTRQDLTYTLQELARGFNLIEPDKPPVYLPDPRMVKAKAIEHDKRPASERDPIKRKGWFAQRKRLADDLEAIEQHQGGFKKGFRRWPMFLYARVLAQVEGPSARSKILKRIEAMASRCQPPYPSDKSDSTIAQIVSDALAGKFTSHRFNRRKLCEALRVTPELARELELGYLVPDEERLRRFTAVRFKNRNLVRQRRVLFIEQILKDRPSKNLPTLKGIKDLLAQRYGRSVSLPTISRDLRRLGVAVAPGARGRPRKESPKA